MMIEDQVQATEGSVDRTMLLRDEKKKNRQRVRSFHWNRVCPHCGAKDLIPAGSCHVCRNCGAGSGCS